jgi:uncharacterized protein (TIGR02594 family)
MTLPSKYRFLLDEPGPRILTEGLRLYGTREVAGSGSNPTILQWARELDIPYNADAIPWCGLYMAIVAHRAGWPTTSQPLWARSWATWQTRAERPSLGDILVFSRGPAHGHVGIYVGESATAFHVLGGNQDDMVSIVPIARSRLLAARRPTWRISEPENRRPITITGRTSRLSTNEA